MPIIREPTVQLVGLTRFLDPGDVDWKTDTTVDSQQLIEFSGRMCYQSWHNPASRSNEEYIGNMLDHGHLSVIEHGIASFAIKGISRSLTHELVRHRHFSYSQLSQRYVSSKDANFVEPQTIAEEPEAHQLFTELCEHAQKTYRRLSTILQKKYTDVPDRTLRRKLARQAARSVLPNATETQLVMTGNFRAWRHFIRMRASEHADVEIRHGRHPDPALSPRGCTCRLRRFRDPHAGRWGGGRAHRTHLRLAPRRALREAWDTAGGAVGGVRGFVPWL